MPEKLAFEDRPWRPCVGIMLLSRDNLVFVADRIDTPDEVWQMPQGGIDEGEEPEAAALRELEEEIGTRNVEILDRTEEWLRYDLPRELADGKWQARYRGQQQLWFACRFLGDDSDINLDTAHPEFTAWRWIPMSDLPSLSVGFKKQVYEHLAARFRHLVEG